MTPNIIAVVECVVYPGFFIPSNAIFSFKERLFCALGRILPMGILFELCVHLCVNAIAKYSMKSRPLWSPRKVSHDRIVRYINVYISMDI